MPSPAIIDFIIGSAFATISRVAQRIIGTTIAIVQEELDQIFPDLRKSYSQARQTVDVTAQDLADIDTELTRRKESMDRAQNSADKTAIEELVRLRDVTYKEYQEAQGQAVKQEIIENPDLYKESPLGEGQENKLLYHTGLVTLKKKCSYCGGAMRLQHRTVDNPTFSDFFWQCTGYYSSAQCRKTMSFSTDDLKLLHRSDIPEIEITKDDLLTIATEPEIQKTTNERLRGHLGESDVDVLCPVHMTPMILRMKIGANEMPLLDKYHLRCPNPNCSQTTKLKSFPQLAAYLRRKEGKGILIS
jgi:hypothetical protein